MSKTTTAQEPTTSNLRGSAAERTVTMTSTTTTTTCGFCGRPADAPFVERNADGSIRFGCVGERHEGHVHGDHAEWIANARAAGLDGKW